MRLTVVVVVPLTLLRLTVRNFPLNSTRTQGNKLCLFLLQANLPLLQRELMHCARIAKQTPQQFLTQNEHIVFDPAHSPLESQDSILSDVNENGKRRASPERYNYNSYCPCLPQNSIKVRCVFPRLSALFSVVRSDE